MPLHINNNLDAMLVHQQLSLSTDRLARSMDRLSSGLRISRASDDPTGLSVAEKMRSQIRGLEQARQNSQQGISMLQTADGALNEVQSLLLRAREICVQFNNGIYDNAQKQLLCNELAAISAQIGLLGTTTNFNGVPILQNGGQPITFQIGTQSGESVSFVLPTLMDSSNSLCNPNDFMLMPFFPSADINDIDIDISRVAAARAQLGAIQNRLEHSISSIEVQQEKLMTVESGIRDVDMASEMTELTRQQIMQQSNTQMLALIHQSSEALLQLIR